MISARLLSATLVLIAGIGFGEVASEAGTSHESTWTPVNITEVDAALKNPNCKNNEYVKSLPDTQGHPISSFDVVFKPSEVVFRGKRRSVVTVQQLVRMNAEWMRDEFRRVADERTPKDTCDDISRGNINYSVPGDGTLVAEFDVHYQKNACTDGVCYKGWHHAWWGGYPEFGRCSWKTNVPGGSAVIGVRTVMTPQLVTIMGFPAVQIHIVPTVGVKEGPSELVKNIVGGLTFGIGSKFIQDTFEHEVGDFRSSLSPEMRTVAFLNLPDARREEPIKFQPEQPFFEKPGAEILFTTGQVATVQPELARQVQTKAVEAKKFFESCVHPQTEYAVLEGDNLWRIAKQLYGEGQFYHVIANVNQTRQGQENVLHAGQTLKVTPYCQLVGPNEALVKYGDTLWEISKAKLGDPLLYPRLLQQNGDKINDPRKLNTLMPIVVRPN